MGVQLSVVLPCYNEEKAIPKVLNELIDFKSKKMKENILSDLEVIVVDDGSTDTSLELLQKIDGIKIISMPKNEGYGAALKVGISAARNEWIGFYDLDGTCHPEDLMQVIPLMQNQTPYMFCGVRMNMDSKMPFVRKLGNGIFRSLVSLFLGSKVKDACSGYRFFHKTYADKYVAHLPNQLNFTLAMTILTLRNHLNYREFTVNYTERLGESKLSALFDGVRFLGTILRYRFSRRLRII
ncbi:MAG: glycosyltransferase family 2 protein [Bdellovibrionales bacterium]